ncbi:MAG: flagellar M-ring protein FliF [Rhodospirillum sp.]|nr:flagellar M-ring protein FliF [Rhodospirillum sp.]MCF8489337.1 flagellar M-ring protein FliF [Rhodospirillum sp.]
MNNLVQTLRNLGPVQLAAIAGAGIAIIGMIIYFASQFSSAQMDLLYGDLAPSDAKGIISQLEEQNIPYQMADEGKSILVPSNQVLKLRVQMAEMAMPTGATVGYELFDNSSALGSTQFTQNINMVRALEGELSRTIRSIDGVEGTRVHLVLPRREPFTREQVDPSASVVVRMKGRRLQAGQVVAIQNLVAASVPSMQPSQVAIIDERGNLLTKSADETGSLAAAEQDERRKTEERRLARAIETLLERTVGVGKVRAEVVAEMDFNRTVINKETFDPDGQVLRSSTTVDESNKSSDTVESVSVAQNLPDGTFNNNGGAPTSSTTENRTEETVNYEITKMVTNEIKEAGEIRRLSVAVMVDGVTNTDANGDKTWDPRPEEEMTKINALVRSAMGFDATRGDQIEVVNMRFADTEDLFAEEDIWRFAGFTKDEIFQIGQGAGILIVALLVILLVVRPLVTRAFENMPSGDQAGGGLLTAEMGGAPQLTGPGGVPMPAGMMGVPDEIEDAEELIDIDKVEGRVKASSLRKIGEIVDKHPEEALSIIRNWLYQES